MDDWNNDRIPLQKAKLSYSNQTDLKKFGFLRDDFSDEELAALDKTLLEPMGEEDLSTWYDTQLLVKQEPSRSAEQVG